MRKRRDRRSVRRVLGHESRGICACAAAVVAYAALTLPVAGRARSDIETGERSIKRHP